MKFSIITFLTISSLLFIQPTQSTLPIPGLIEHVCRLTPHYHLCVLTLKSHAIARKITSQYDVAEFAKITLKVIAAKTPAILATLRKVHEQCEQPEFKLALEGCISSYTKISLDILPKALGCVDKGDLDGIKQHALATANLAASCQKKCNAFTASSLSAFANSGSSSAGSTKTGSSSTGAGSINTGSSSAGSTNTGSSSTGSGSINTGSSASGSINTGSSSAGSINTGSSSAGSAKTGSSAAGSINTGSSSAGSSKTGSSSAGSTNTGSSTSADSTKTGSSSASGTDSASAAKPAVMAAAKVVGDSNVYVQNMCAITVSIVTKVSASKQTTLKS